jgi:hypothetical protein
LRIISVKILPLFLKDEVNTGTYLKPPAKHACALQVKNREMGINLDKIENFAKSGNPNI